jgi:hypothetical protein
MDILTGNLDSDRLILENLDNTDLLTVCKLSNKYIEKLCNENFFRRRISSSFPRAIKPENLTWRKYYKYLIYWIGKLEKEFHFRATEKLGGDPKFYYYFLNPTKMMHNYDKILKEIFLNNFLYQMIKYNLSDLIEYIIQQGADLEKGLFEASRINNKEAFFFIVSLGAKNFEEALTHTDDKEMKEYIRSYIKK